MRRAFWPLLLLLMVLYVVLFVPIMPFRVPCYDGDPHTLEGQVVYPYVGALMRELV